MRQATAPEPDVAVVDIGLGSESGFDLADPPMLLDLDHNPTSVVNWRQRFRIAEQLMDMVARPENRNQGATNLCAPTTIEGLLLSGTDGHPSVVTHAVADVALTGKTDIRGIEVKIDPISLQSLGTLAENQPSGANTTRLAEHIFRLVASNTYFATERAHNQPDGDYELRHNRSGYFLYNRETHKPEIDQHTGKINDGPGAASTSAGVLEILQQMTGEDYSGRVLDRKDPTQIDPPGVTLFTTLAQFRAAMRSAYQRDTTVALGVFSNNRELIPNKPDKPDKDERKPGAAAGASDGRGGPKADDQQAPPPKPGADRTLLDAKEVFSGFLDGPHEVMITPEAQMAFINNSWGDYSKGEVKFVDLCRATAVRKPNSIIRELKDSARVCALRMATPRTNTIWLSSEPPLPCLPIA